MKLLAASLFISCLLCGCASWEVTRTEIVEPIHELLHKAYPDALRAMDTQRFASLSVEENRHEFEDQARHLLAGFARIDHAECPISSATPPDQDGVVTVILELQLDGTDGEDRRRSLVAQRRIRAARRSGNWRILSDEALRTEVHEEQGPSFADEAVERGIVFRSSSRGVVDRAGNVQGYIPGSGLAVGDVDGDGFEDLLLVSGGDLRLFRNRGGVFQDESDERGIQAPPSGECRFAVFADIDNDGNPDIFVGVIDGPNIIFRNQGDGNFLRVDSDEIGVRSTGETTSACFADFDGDGDLDLFLANGGNLLRIDPRPIYNARNGVPNQLFLNNGDGTFRDATARAGVGQPGWALACSTSDYDQDGDVDLFVANDFGPDLLYRNRGDATFEEVASRSGIIYRGSSMGASFGDVDGDGDVDLFVTGMASGSAWILAQPGFPAPAPWPLNILLRSHVLATMNEMIHGNRLYLNRGDGTFVETSTASGVRNSGWGWGGVFLDYDNDMDLDIYVPNGLLSGENPDEM